MDSRLSDTLTWRSIIVVMIEFPFDLMFCFSTRLRLFIETIHSNRIERTRTIKIRIDCSEVKDIGEK